MVIQRWQSVFLLLATILVTIFCFVPSAIISDGEKSIFFPSENILYLGFNLAIALLFLLSIFMYRNTRRQRRFLSVAMVLTAISLVAGVVIVYSLSTTSTVDIQYGWLLLIAALISAFAAYRNILADERLLRSYERLR